MNSPSWTHRPENQDLPNQAILLCVNVMCSLSFLRARNIMDVCLVNKQYRYSLDILQLSVESPISSLRIRTG